MAQSESVVTTILFPDVDTENELIFWSWECKVETDVLSPCVFDHNSKVAFNSGQF